MGKADIGGKRVLGAAPETWVRWLFNDPTLEVRAALTEEFRFVLRHSDELLWVQGATDSFLLLTELQLHRDPEMDVRMRAYAALAEQQYRLPVYPVVLLLLPPGDGESGVRCYHREFMGLMAHQDYRVLAAWQIDAREMLEREVLALTPYIPLMAGADPEVVSEGVKLLRRRGMGEEMEVVLALFASFVMDPEQVQDIMRWNMAVLRESPWYREIYQEGQLEGQREGRLEGQREGRLEGQREGRLEGQREGILRLLEARFGLSTETVQELSNLLRLIAEPSKLVDLLIAAAQVESLEAFRERLNGARQTGGNGRSGDVD